MPCHMRTFFFRKYSVFAKSPIITNTNTYSPSSDISSTRTTTITSSTTATATTTSSSSTLSPSDITMPDHGYKRLSFPALSPRSSIHRSPTVAATLEAVMESPPLVFFGSPAESTGALLSGQLILTVRDESLAIDSFSMKLTEEVTRKKPFHSYCKDCANQQTELTSWVFLKEPASLQRGEHRFPFSFLLAGHLPATTKGHQFTMGYVLRAAVISRGGEPVKFVRDLVVKRAILPSETPRISTRIFPPTNMTTVCHLPSAIHPIGESLVSLRIDGCIQRYPETSNQKQWRLKRLTWRLVETQTTTSPACQRHRVKLGKEEVDQQKKKDGTLHTGVRTIGSAVLYAGWKADYSNPDGSIEMDVPIAIRPDGNSACDVKSNDTGIEVSHLLIMEMIVGEEHAPIQQPAHATATGIARVLRMQFSVTVTERSGLGISWDEEQPPLYEHVPESPPSYGTTDSYDEPMPDYGSLNRPSAFDSDAGPSGPPQHPIREAGS